MRIEQTQLLFLSGNVMNPNTQRALGIPLEFITFAHVRGNLYHHKSNKGTFIGESTKRLWGNNVVYGALFLLRDFHFYIRLLDAYHTCSKSTLFKNHFYDVHHRVKRAVTPISFQTKEELCTLRYTEKEPISAYLYMGNPKHPNITQRTNNVHSYRIIQGIEPQNFLPLLWEVLP